MYYIDVVEKIGIFYYNVVVGEQQSVQQVFQGVYCFVGEIYCKGNGYFFGKLCFGLLVKLWFDGCIVIQVGCVGNLVQIVG